MDTHTRKVRIKQTPHPYGKGFCPVRPSKLIGKATPMDWCHFKAGHPGRHSWEEGAMTR